MKQQKCSREREKKNVCVLGMQGSRAFAIRALAVLETTVYLNGYSDCLPVFLVFLLSTILCEPLSLSYNCHAGLKIV